MNTFLEKNIFYNKRYIISSEEITFKKFLGKKSTGLQETDISQKLSIVNPVDLPFRKSTARSTLSKFLQDNIKSNPAWLDKFLNLPSSTPFWWYSIDQAMVLIQLTPSVLARFRISSIESKEKVLLLIAAALYSDIINFNDYYHET